MVFLRRIFMGREFLIVKIEGNFLLKGENYEILKSVCVFVFLKIFFKNFFIGC